MILLIQIVDDKSVHKVELAPQISRFKFVSKVKASSSWTTMKLWFSRVKHQSFPKAQGCIFCVADLSVKIMCSIIEVAKLKIPFWTTKLFDTMLSRFN